MKGEDGLENVNDWLEEGPPLRLQPLEEEYGLVPLQQPREFRGDPLWWEKDTAPNEEILTEHPATMWEKFGWIYDVWACLVARCQELFRSVEFLIGFILLVYGCGLVVFLLVVSNYLSNSPPRELPTIDDLMTPAAQQEAPIPMEGLNDTKETDE